MKLNIYYIYITVEGREGSGSVPCGDLPRVIVDCEGDRPRTNLGALEIESRHDAPMSDEVTIRFDCVVIVSNYLFILYCVAYRIRVVGLIEKVLLPPFQRCPLADCACLLRHRSGRDSNFFLVKRILS